MGAAERSPVDADAPATEGGLAQLVASRRAKAEGLRAAGLDPYPARSPRRTHLAAEAIEAFESGGAAPTGVRLSGRLVGAIRLMGGAAFVHLRDESGAIQLHLRRDVLGERMWPVFTGYFDAGDIVSVCGDVFRTRRGEVTLQVVQLDMVAKSLLPLPEKWHGLLDRETTFRRRYLDLLSSEVSRRRFVDRSRIVSAMRAFLDARGFLEVETPILQPMYGGGTADPFVTEYRALEQRMYLRIADELYLKRLLVGGFEKVYEIGKDFRNEGIDRTHLPEFTQMECYWAYADYNDMMALTEEMVAHIAIAVRGSTVIAVGDVAIDVAPPWRRLAVRDALQDAIGLNIDEHSTVTGLQEALRSKGVAFDPQASWARTVDKLLQIHVEPRLEAPTFLLDYPLELSPLAKRIPGNDRYVERFEPFVAGIELGNSFTELNDPVDQRARLEAAASGDAAADAEAHPVDEDFLEALMHGMPAAGGLGIGVDRVVMLLTGAANIRDVVLFPQLRNTRESRP